MSSLPRYTLALSIAVLCMFLSISDGHSAIPKGWDSRKYAALIIDGNTGQIIHSKNASVTRHPASLTKMMTLYVAFSELSRRKLRLRQHVRISRHAAAQPPMRIGLKRGTSVPIQTLIEAVIIRSGNDAAAALAEAIGGTESRFAGIMNRYAEKLGMKRTHFRNASGLPDRKQITTAEDMAKLAIALKRDFPQYYHLFKKERFSFNGKTFTSHNHVTRNYHGADGLKTGYIRMSGFNLVTSAQRHNKRLIGVVMGGTSGRARDKHMTRMLDLAFSGQYKYGRGRVYAGNYKTPVPILKPGLYKKQLSNTAPSVASKIAPASQQAIAVAFNPNREYGFIKKKVSLSDSAPIPVFKNASHKNIQQSGIAKNGRNIPILVLKPSIAANIAYAQSTQQGYNSPFIKRMSPAIKPKPLQR